MTTENSEQNIESKLIEKGLDAPRLCPADIDKVIVSETFTKLPSGKCLICEITLKNGFTVRGESACVSVANFNEEIGREISRKDARNKIWGFEGYLLQQRLFGESIGNAIRSSETPKDRVEIELADLNEKLAGLNKFIASEFFLSFPVTKRSGLINQRDVMVTYRDILTTRLEGWEL